MAEDLLERILREVRERKDAARAAYEESRRLEAALAALGPARARQERPAGPPPGSRPKRARGAAGGRTPRGENRRRILEVVGERAGVSAGEVAQVTGIARPTVASTLAKMAADGDVQRVERPAGGVGFRIPAPDGPGSAERDPPARDANEDAASGADASEAAPGDGAEDAAGSGDAPPDAGDDASPDGGD